MNYALTLYVAVEKERCVERLEVFEGLWKGLDDETKNVDDEVPKMRGLVRKALGMSDVFGGGERSAVL